MASSSSSSTPSTDLATTGDPVHGGALFTVPREIRDKIYRLLVKGHYFTVDDYPTERGDIPTAIYRVSRAISQEALHIWLSESSFSFDVNFDRYQNNGVPHEHMKCMEKVVLRLKNIPVIHADNEKVGINRASILDHVRTTCKRGIAPYMAEDFACNTLILGIKWQLLYLMDATIDETLSPILETFEAVSRFETVAFKIAKEREEYSRCSNPVPRSMVQYLDLIQEVDTTYEEQFQEVARVIRNKLEPVLGPAFENHSPYVSVIGFHPQKFLTGGTK